MKTIEDRTCNLSPLLYKSAVSALDKGQTSDKDSGQTWGNDQWNFFESRSACCDLSLQIPSSCETKGKRQEADSGQQSSCLLSVSFRHILPYFPFPQLQSWKPYLKLDEGLQVGQQLFQNSWLLTSQTLQLRRDLAQLLKHVKEISLSAGSLGSCKQYWFNRYIFLVTANSYFRF